MLPPEAAPRRHGAAPISGREVRAAFSTRENVANIKFEETSGSPTPAFFGSTRRRAGALLRTSRSKMPRLGGACRWSAIRQPHLPQPASALKIGFDLNLDVYDVRFTVAHEIGHVGLDHPSPAGQLMSFRHDEGSHDLQPAISPPKPLARGRASSPDSGAAASVGAPLRPAERVPADLENRQAPPRHTEPRTASRTRARACMSPYRNYRAEQPFRQERDVTEASMISRTMQRQMAATCGGCRLLRAARDPVGARDAAGRSRARKDDTELPRPGDCVGNRRPWRASRSSDRPSPTCSVNRSAGSMSSSTATARWWP